MSYDARGRIAFRRFLAEPVAAVSGQLCHYGGSRGQLGDRGGRHCCHRGAWRASRLTRMTLPCEVGYARECMLSGIQRAGKGTHLLSRSVRIGRWRKRETHGLGWLHTSTARACACAEPNVVEMSLRTGLASRGLESSINML